MINEQLNRKRYSDEFKHDAVKYYFENNRKLVETANNFGISASMLHKWIAKFANESSNATIQIQRTSQNLSDSSSLYNEIITIKEEIDILKKDLKAMREIVQKSFLQRFTDEV